MRKPLLTMSQRISSEKTGVMRTWAPQSFWHLKCQNPQIHFTKHPLKCPWICLDVGRILQRITPVSAQVYLCSTGGSWLRMEQKAALPCRKDRLDFQEKANAHETEEGENTRGNRQTENSGATTLVWQRDTMNEQTWYPAIPWYYESPYFCCSSPF